MSCIEQPEKAALKYFTVSKKPDNWAQLRQHHVSRIIVKNGLNNGNHLPSLPVAHINNILWENVYEPLMFKKIEADLHTAGWNGTELFSKANNKEQLLANPNLGKILEGESEALLQSFNAPPTDIALVVLDYLNAKAVHNHSVNVLETFRKRMEPKGITFAPVTVVQNGNCAVGAEIGKLLNARYVITFFGDKPFLHANNNLSAQLLAIGNQTSELPFKISAINNVGTSYSSAATELINAFLKAERG